MTKIKTSKYKVLRQHYIDLWKSDKRGVKVLRKIILLRIFMHVLESKRWLLKQVHAITEDNNYPGRSLYRLNLYISQRLERMLQFIPDTYIDLNTKTRIFKYIKRKSVRRFGSLERVFFDLIRILEKQKDGSSSKYTSFRVFFRRKQLLQSYYGNITLKWLRKIVRTYKLALPELNNKNQLSLHSLLESRLDNIIYNISRPASIFAAQQFINHGFVKVNNHQQYTTNVLLTPGDVISQLPKINNTSVKLEVLHNLFDLHYLFKVENKSNTKSFKSTDIQYQKSLNPFVNKNDNTCYLSLFSSLLINNTISNNNLHTANTLFPAWDILEQTIRYKKIQKNLPLYWKYVLYLTDLDQYVYLERPQHYNYPFAMDNYAMRLFALQLHR